MNTLYLRLPSAAATRPASVDPSLTCSFALTSHQGAIARSGDARLSSLAATIAGSERVVLLLAAVDVTLLAINAPPLSAGRLKLALPGLVEEHILDDPENCVMVPGATVDGLLTVAVMRREWLQALANACLTLGAKKLLAWPLQSCLPHFLQQDDCVAVLHEHPDETRIGMLELGMHIPAKTTLGVSLHATESDGGVQQAMAALRLLMPHGAMTLLVPPQRVSVYRQAADADISVQADDWSLWIKSATPNDRADRKNIPDMMSAIATTRNGSSNLRAWRRPLQLAAAVLLLNTVALNIDWWRLHREAGTLKAGMTQTYRASFPNERVILDPLLQMQQKIAAAKRAAGEPLPDDFIALAASFATAWTGLPANGDAAIASLDYRDRSLLLRLKPQAAEQQSDDFQQQLQAALSGQKLVLQQGAADAWQIRRAP